MSYTGCLSSNQEAVISADMRGITLSEGKQIEKKMKKTCADDLQHFLGRIYS